MSIFARSFVTLLATPLALLLDFDSFSFYRSHKKLESVFRRQRLKTKFELVLKVEAL